MDRADTIGRRGRGVITGSGAVSPLGRSAAEFFARLTAGETAVRPLTPEERGGLQATEVASFPTFSPQPEIPPMKARRLDRGSQFALIACTQAVTEAGYDIGADPEAIGIAMGTGSAGAGALTEFLRVLFLESPEAAPPFHFPNTVANAPASQTSIELKIYGPNVTITQKDPSALNALLFSALALASGRAKAMLAGAVDEWNFYYAMGFDRVGALRGERRASGIVQGEGAFVVLLEDEASARARGVKPLARLAGIATAGVASEPYRFAPDASGIGRAIRGALEDAAVSPAEVDLWLPSRDGVVEMDRAEAGVMRAIFGDGLPRELAVKDVIGEMAAAGGAQLVAASRALASGRARRALVNSFGAGGNFLAAVLEAA
ncbi:MAG TPA: beta-ketoacyl synthase N-terminal-like domain-containing protein [Thermoanaerobaculia bacterium]|nr:beta-ketoacyl synthase N-terminal-like domain-containing protein [Thermoanaerobaculia bacterium]